MKAPIIIKALPLQLNADKRISIYICVFAIAYIIWPFLICKHSTIMSLGIISPSFWYFVCLFPLRHTHPIFMLIYTMLINKDYTRLHPWSTLFNILEMQCVTSYLETKYNSEVKTKLVLLYNKISIL